MYAKPVATGEPQIAIRLLEVLLGKVVYGSSQVNSQLTKLFQYYPDSEQPCTNHEHGVSCMEG